MFRVEKIERIVMDKEMENKMSRITSRERVQNTRVTILNCGKVRKECIKRGWCD